MTSDTTGYVTWTVDIGGAFTFANHEEATDRMEELPLQKDHILYVFALEDAQVISVMMT